jgi:outer membrane protein assembly factor BamB
MAYARGRVFVPVVERCMRERSADPAFPADLRRGDGVLVALSARTGRQLWTRRLGSPATGCATVASDVVFVPTLDGRIFAFAASDGRTLWQTRARAGINGCPSVSRGLLLVGAGAPTTDGRRGAPELTAYGLPGYGP